MNGDAAKDEHEPLLKFLGHACGEYERAASLSASIHAEVAALFAHVQEERRQLLDACKEIHTLRKRARELETQHAEAAKRIRLVGAALDAADDAPAAALSDLSDEEDEEEEDEGAPAAALSDLSDGSDGDYEDGDEEDEEEEEARLRKGTPRDTSRINAAIKKHFGSVASDVKQAIVWHCTTIVTHTLGDWRATGGYPVAVRDAVAYLHILLRDAVDAEMSMYRTAEFCYSATLFHPHPTSISAWVRAIRGESQQ